MITKEEEKEFKNVECILSGKNIGYAMGNNIGLRNTKTKYALILNPDAKLFPKTLENELMKLNEAYRQMSET